MSALGIASILHRDTIAVIVGTKTFERGESCFAAGRVVDVASSRGELRGVVEPQERGRAKYAVRIWVRDDGIAYACSCPVGEERRFCKHAVAIALAHLDREAKRNDALAALRARLASLAASGSLVDTLVDRARTDEAALAMLQRL